MIRNLTLAIATFFTCFSLHSISTAENAYIPIRQSVASGTYHSPNYLSLVKSAAGIEEAYQTFSGVVAKTYPHVVGRFGRDEILINALQKNRTQRRPLLGLYAEERFIDANREAGWRKVNSPFAPQRDVWRRVNGRIEYGQIKVHGLSRGARSSQELAGVYLQSMRKDSGRGQASLFLVPDDHVDAINRLIDQRHSASSRRGDVGEATWLQNQKVRVSPLGFTYEMLSRDADLAEKEARARIVAKYAGRMITVIFLSGLPAYETYRWSTGQISNSDFGIQLGKSGSTVTVSLATSFLISKSDFFMVSPYRAGGVVSGVVFLAEESWLIYRYGGFFNAFSSPDFVVSTGGNLGAAALGLIGAVEGGKFGVILGTPAGPWGMAIGGGIGGLAGGAIGGIVGYLGGATLTDLMLETFSPEFYYGMKVDAIADAEQKICKEIDKLSDLSNPLPVIGNSQ